MQSHTRKRVGRAGVVAGFTFALVPVVGISPAHACSCVAGTEAQHLEAADAVFKGVVRAVTDPPSGEGQSSADPVVYTFDVTRKYKGQVLNPQKVRTAASSASCGLSLSGAGPFLVFASMPEVAQGEEKSDVLEAGLCGGTREIGASEDPSFGAGEPVDPPPTAETPEGETPPETQPAPENAPENAPEDGSRDGLGLLDTLLDRIVALLRGLLGDTRAT